MISDTHFGLRNGSQEWMEMIKSYFFEFFIPLLKKESKKGDFLVHCGDVFDSRHSINLFAMNIAMEIFEEISKILPIVIIVGNHDIAKKNSNDVNSLKMLKWIPNVKIIENPEIIDVSGKRLLFMPWRSSIDEASKCLKENDADFLFCHSDVKDLRFNRTVIIDDGINMKEMKKFRKVFSGHIHYSQSKGNFRMLGCPYQMTRSDINNEKGIWLFDIENEIETFFKNDFSSKFLKIKFEQLMDVDEILVKRLFRNNFIDILIDSKWTLSFPFSDFSDDMIGYRSLNFIPITKSDENNMNDENDDDLDDVIVDFEKIDILELADELIKKTEYSDSTKKNLIKMIAKLYENVQKSSEEKEFIE